MASWLKAGDVINGKEGSVYANINGKLINMLEIKKLRAKVSKEKTDIPVLGNRAVQSKAKGYKGTGSVTAYYVASEMRELMLQYMNTGKDVYFTIIATNEDNTTDIGKQRIQLNNVNLDEVSLVEVDVTSDSLEEDFTFTFDSAIALDLFVRPTYFDA